MKQLASLFAVIILCSNFSFAQDSKTWTLEQCVDYAFKNNLNLKTSENTTVINRNTLTQSKMNYLPSVSAGGSLSQSDGGRTFDPYTNQAVQGATFRNSNLNISSNWNLFSGFQVTNTIKSNKAGLEASQLDVATQKNTIALNVINSYVNVLNGYEQVANAEKQLVLSKEQVIRTQKLVDAGASAEVNLLNLQAQQASDELTLITNQNTLDLAKLQLQQFMQKPLETSFEVAKPDISSTMLAGFPRSSNDVYQTALGTQPQIKAADIRITQSIHNISTSLGAFSPTLSFSGGYFTSYSNTGSQYIFDGTTRTVQSSYFLQDATGNPSQSVYQVVPNGRVEKISINNQFDNNLRSSLSLSLNIPIFSQWQTQSNYANAKIRKYNAENSAQLERSTLRQNIEQAWLEARLAEKSYNASAIQVKALEAAFKTNEIRFNNGALTAIDFNTSKTNLVKAQSDLIRAKYNLVLKTKVLEYYEGKPITF